MIADFDIPNPFRLLGDQAVKVVEDGWTGIMMSLWSAGLWVLRFVLGLMDQFLTPDLTAGGPAAEIYRVTFWAAGVLVVIMGLVQLGIAGFQRDGKSLARVLIGFGQFAVIWGGWISYGIAVVSACGEITHALMNTLLGVDSWAGWEPWDDLDLGDDTAEATVATVLGILGLFLWIAAVGHFVVLLTRAAALLILAATTPIAAAGLVSETGRTWFWKSLRWFHAAALTPVLTVLMLGTGVKLTEGVATGRTTGVPEAVGTALPATMLILVSAVAPVALFRLLAFVDPGTSSGAAMRQGLAATGGITGLLTGSSGSSSIGGAASATTPSGGSGGEAQSADATSSRFGSAVSSMGGAIGGAYAAGLSAVIAAGTKAATAGTDEMNQTAVGDSSYFPDYQPAGARFNPDQRDPQPNPSGSPSPDSASGPHPPTTPSPTSGPSASSAGGAGAAGGGAAAAGGGVPPVV